jgi:TonB family protein
MHASGRVRVAAAFAVAVALHVLMISIWPSTNAVTQPASAIHIVGLYHEHAADAADAAAPAAVERQLSRPTATVRAAVEPQAVQTSVAVLAKAADTEATAETVAISRHVARNDDIRETALVPVQERTADRPAAGERVAPSDRSLPASVYTGIMAEMHYPRMARRNGWQGEVALRLDVRDRTIRQVTMLASSGYPLLDRAAHRGIGRIRSLPLADGFYRLPVIFRLQ